MQNILCKSGLFNVYALKNHLRAPQKLISIAQKNNLVASVVENNQYTFYGIYNRTGNNSSSLEGYKATGLCGEEKLSNEYIKEHYGFDVRK